EQLRRMLPRLWDADSSDPVRVLLLARGAGEWWTRLTRELDLNRDDAIALEPLDPAEDRSAQFAAAVRAFADRLDRGASGDLAASLSSLQPPPDLQHDRYGSPLTLQLAALTASLELRQPLTETAGHAAAEETLLLHEQRYWDQSARGEGLGLADAILGR